MASSSSTTRLAAARSGWAAAVAGEAPAFSRAGFTLPPAGRADFGDGFTDAFFKDVFFMRIFLAGIMQGSHVAALVHDQMYRNTLRDLVQSHWPEAEVYDPFANHGNSIAYDRRRAGEVFMGHIEMCREFDLLVAYVPEASMGTAIEMWEAHQHGRTVVTITPLVHNWVVQLTSRAVYRDFDAFSHAVNSGEIDRLLTLT
jgi:hypothetical protein